MNKKVVQKLKTLPQGPGVYLYRSSSGRVIYVGKAVNLKNRVSSYFSKQERDPKTDELVKNIDRVDIIETGSEFEALILESDLVKRYRPKYNVRLRDDKGYVYLKITREDYPKISLVRQITESGPEHIGPFMDAMGVRSILKQVRRIFPYCSCERRHGETCLYYHLGLCPGHGEKHISKADYAKNIRGIKKLFSGKTDALRKEFTKEMKGAAKREDFEAAASYRDKLNQLQRIERSHFISERDLASDVALVQLQKTLDLTKLPERIECYDISNIMGTAAVGSMVVFVNGISTPKEYRRFQIRTVKGANDFAMLSEVLRRRFAAQNSKWPKPDLIILDGGKGQLSTVVKNVEMPEGVTVVALAKRFEQIYKIENYGLNSNFKPVRTDVHPGGFQISNLPKDSEAYFLVQRVRDEAHRFAITYHRKVKSRELYETSLDAIPGVGPKTKKRLLTQFGSIQKIREASLADISKVTSPVLAKRIKEKI